VSRVAGAALVWLCACGPPPGAPAPPQTQAPSPRIVVTERGAGGGVLVVGGDDGARLADVTRRPEDGAPVLDVQPAWSPDGRFLVFASTRERGAATATSLWLVEARPDATPRRLTEGPQSDVDPWWMPDGSAIVFASDRAGNFDLWRLDLVPGDDGAPRPDGPPRPLLATPADERHPSFSPTGQALVYERARGPGRREVWRVDGDGRHPRQLSAGPDDGTPAWSPSGKWIAFCGRAPGRSDLDLYVIAADGTRRRRLVSEPLADQHSPRWSHDGSYLFATAVFRAAASQQPILSSIVFVEIHREADRRELFALHDPVVVARMGVALAPAPLDSRLAAKNPRYDARTLRLALEDLCRDQPEESRPASCKAFDP
jgi:dipeptidyl aminopeptidase/acylaminoacyl peptidase